MTQGRVAVGRPARPLCSPAFQREGEEEVVVVATPEILPASGWAPAPAALDERAAAAAVAAVEEVEEVEGEPARVSQSASEAGDAALTGATGR